MLAKAALRTAQEAIHWEDFMLDATPTAIVAELSVEIRGGLSGGSRSRERHVRRGVLLARSRRLHLEHQDNGGPEADPRHARACLKRTGPSGWRIAEGESPDRDSDGIIEAIIALETAVARAEGLIRLKDGRIWTLLTAIVELKGYEEKSGPTRPLGALHGSNPGAKTWKERREEEIAKLGFETQPAVLIIGGGQGGIALASRLRQLDVPTIVIEKNERAGDSWRKRYKSLCLHDPVWYDHLPYIDFPATGRSSRPRTRSATGSKCMFA